MVDVAIVSMVKHLFHHMPVKGKMRKGGHPGAVPYYLIMAYVHDNNAGSHSGSVLHSKKTWLHFQLTDVVNQSCTQLIRTEVKHAYLDLLSMLTGQRFEDWAALDQSSHQFLKQIFLWLFVKNKHRHKEELPVVFYVNFSMLYSTNSAENKHSG